LKSYVKYVYFFMAIFSVPT